MTGKLEGKVIIVAGAGGIGDALARRYAEEGASILLGDLDGKLANSVAGEIVAEGGTAIAAEFDGTDDESTRALFALALDRFGGVDGVHINFVNYRDNKAQADIVDVPMDVFDEVMNVNVRGRVLCTRHAVPAILARGGGSILYSSSGAAFVPLPSRAVYAMSKAANHALMRHVALRFGPQGIRANVLSLGSIAHDRFIAAGGPEKYAQLYQGKALSRFGTTTDAVAMSALLMSDEGSYVTGQVISVDGGASMRQ